MNIKELLQEINKVINKETLNEFALPLRKLNDRIEEKTPKIFEHLYKMIGFRDENTVHHWAAELGAFLQICNIKVKSGNKVLTPTQISKTMLLVYSDVKEFSSIGGELYSEYGYSEYKDSQIYNKIKEVLPNLIQYIQTLEEDERVNPNTILEIIGELE